MNLDLAQNGIFLFFIPLFVTISHDLLVSYDRPALDVFESMDPPVALGWVSIGQVYRSKLMRAMSVRLLQWPLFAIITMAAICGRPTANEGCQQ
jgi:hypothetical protein